MLITRTGDKYMKNGEKDTVGEGCRYAAGKNHKRRAAGRQQVIESDVAKCMEVSLGDRCGGIENSGI